MPDDTMEDIRDSIRKNLLKYSQKAFRMLPHMDLPRILDLGCGTGVPTMELARLGGGEVLGLDIDRHSLDLLAKKIEEAGLAHRVRTKECSITEMDLPKDHFDIVWCEGSIFVLGFRNGLVRLKRLLKEKGCLVVHDEAGDIPEKLKIVSSCGYDLLGHFTLSRNVWWTEYFEPLQKRIDALPPDRKNEPDMAAELVKERRDMDTFRNDPAKISSAYFVMRKR